MSDAVLIVDDSLTVRMDLTETLGIAGLASTARATLAEAREALAGGTFRLVILDVLLPDGDGVDLLREIRASPTTGATPVMLLSTEAEVADRVRGMATGADEYVGKPYEPSYLVARARELIDRSAGLTAVAERDTILVIDDSITFREGLREVLESASFRVVIAGSGEAGLQAAAREHPSAVIVDGVLPGADGASVIRRIRLDAALRGTPCLLLTGSADADAELRALDSGADAFVRKAEDTGIVLARLTALLRSASAGPRRRAAASLHAPKRILTVDDSDTYLHALGDALRGAGYEVVPARSGEEALELLAVQSVDCILLDLRMPGIGGEETCRRIKAAPGMRGTPIIMLTFVEDHEAMIRGLGAGADDYLAKSGEFEVLCARILAQLRRKQFDDENRLAREELLRSELAASEAQAAREVAETRAALAEEQQIRTQMERAAALLEAAPDSVVIVDQTDRIAMVNARTEMVFGFPRSDMLGQPVEMLIPRWLHGKPHRPGREPAIGAMQLFARRCDGSEFPVEVSLSPLTLPEGTLLIGTIRDVTERNRAEKRIQAQLEHLHLLDRITRAISERQDLRSIFQVVVQNLEDSLPIDFGCVCTYDPAADALHATCIGVKSTGLAQTAMLAEEAAISIDDNGLRCCIQGQLVYEPSIAEVRFPFPERLGRSGLGSLVLAPLRTENRVFGVLVAARRAAHAFTSVECEFLRQLSEHIALAAHQAQLYGALQEAFDHLRQTQEAMLQEERLRALGQMASGIAHDINNALSPVSLYTEAMLESEAELSERARFYLETIQRAVEDVTETVARMREFYRQREPQLELARVQLNRMVEQVIDLTRARWNDMAQESGVTIRTLAELLPDLPEIMGVESEIREALTNLVLNAVDAMPEGGALTLRTGLAAKAAVIVEVKDSGIGMTEETRQRCLEPFFTTKGERGTGLGLAMVFGAAQRHGADIEIDSIPGTGTTMRLVFAAAPAADAEIARPAAVPPLAPLRLLLIDDDPVLLTSLRDALAGDGHVIVTANGGEAGITALHANLDQGEPFAAVITDLGMPYLDGRRVAAAIKAAAPATPVILLTGWGRQLRADGDTPPHVDRVLAKPPRLHELRDALRQLCQPAS